MKNLSADRNYRQGSALGMALIFMTFMLILGTGLIALAEHSAKQSAASIRADRLYYSAESAGQLGAQILLNELDESLFYKVISGIPHIPNMTHIKNEFESEMRTNLQAIYSNAVTPKVNGLKFNNEEARLGDELLLTDLVIEEDFWKERNSSGVESYKAVVYIDNPIFTIEALSGGRTVTVKARFTTNMEVEIIESPGGAGAISGALYPGGTEGIYDGGNDALYESLRSELSSLLSEADADYEFFRIRSNIINNLTAPGFPGASGYNANAALNAKYINTWDRIILGRHGEETTYENLEFIESGQPMEIRGIVHTPNLKGGFVNGMEVYGTWFCPKLENLYLGGAHSNIHAGAKINPMVVDASGNIVEHNRPTNGNGSNNFYGNQNIFINCDAEINWGRFNYQRIFLNYGSHGKLTSNSIFISRNEFDTSGTASSDINRVIPQFYVRGYTRLQGSIGTIAGIFMTLSHNHVFSDGNGPPSGTDFTGLFLGNYNLHHPPHVVQDTAFGFPPESLDILMDGSWISEAAGLGGGTIEVNINFEYDYKDLNLRETTGEIT